MKSERFEMRLDEVTATRIDEWREQQRDLSSRAEAVRRLIDLGLSASQPNEFYPSNSEKLLISMVCGIMKKVGATDEIDPSFIDSAVSGGHYWALGSELSGIFQHSIDAPSSARQVVDILDMWSFIEEAMEELSPAEVNELKAESGVSSTGFLGFDGNHETEHMSIARFMIEKMDRFQRFKNHEMGLNSHMPTVARYVKMAEEFQPIRITLIGRRMNLAELKAVLSWER